jgi:hypothetical protein
MPDSLEIRDIGTLNDLRVALGRFAGDIRSALSAVEKEIQQTLEWLYERMAYWQGEVERAVRQVEQADSELSACESIAYEDDEGRSYHRDCSRERYALLRAEQHQRECRSNLEVVQASRSRVLQSYGSYSHEARRLASLASDHTARAQSELSTLGQRYEAVRQSQASAGIVEAIAGGVAALASVLTSGVPFVGHEEVGIQELEPDAKYFRGAYEFHTDSKGRPKTVSGTLELKAGPRSPLQTRVGKLGRMTDEGGHLIGTRFNGPTDAFNLVPQDAELNRGAWRAMEGEWARSLGSGHELRVMIDPVYDLGHRRPSSFQVVYQVDLGNPRYVFFSNGTR